MKRPPEYFEKMGRQLWFKGEYYRALKLMQEGLEYYPSDFRLRLGVALAQLRLGNYAIARDILKELLSSSPNNGDALCALCEAYLSLGKKNDALACANGIYKAHPKSGTLLEHLGMALLEHGLFDEAIKSFSRAVGAEPKRPYSRLGLGIAYSGLGKQRKAVLEIRKAIRLKPDFYEAISYLGNLFYDVGQKAAAVKLFFSIPMESQIDPVTLSRLLAWCKGRKNLAAKIPEIGRRMEKLSSGQGIDGFLRELEEQAALSGPDKLPLPAKLRFIKLGANLPVNPAQKAMLYDIERRLKSLYARPRAGLSLVALPSVPRARAGDADGFISAFAVYLKSIADNGKQFSRLPMTSWSASLGIDSIAPYAAALIKTMYDENAQFGVSQSSMDALLAALVNTLKWMPPGLRGSDWIAELAGVIVAFWTPVDMLERLFLMREILSPLEKKSVEPAIARGRAWRKWLGWRPDSKWTSPAAQLIPSLPQTYGARKSVKCADCGSPISDYWDIAQAGDAPPVRCGDCASALRCSHCKGPMRQVGAGKKGAKVYRCMQCEKRYQVKFKKLRKPAR